jgi:hypothetical protein
MVKKKDIKPDLRDKEGKFAAGMFVCPKCGAEFPGPNSLEWHEKVCGGEGK